MNAITFRHLSVGYKDREVLSDINLDIAAGQLVCLIGANGAGKSTLLKTIAGFLPKRAGELELLQKPISDYTHDQLARTVSVVLTGRTAVENLSVAEVVGLGRSPYTGFWGTLREADRRVVDRALAQVGITQLASRMINTLSDGEQQKVLIAKAMAQQTPIILLDEPTAFLDYTSRLDLMQLLRRLAHDEGKTIVLSTHDLEMAVALADSLLRVDEAVSAVTPEAALGPDFGPQDKSHMLQLIEQLSGLIKA